MALARHGHAPPGLDQGQSSGQFIDAYDYPEKYAEQAALQKATARGWAELM